MTDIKKAWSCVIRIAAIVCLLAIDTEAHAELACTNDNGTSIVFVNGVNTSVREARGTRRKISDLFIKYEDKKLLDKNGNVNFDNVYNESDGFWNDVKELRNQVLYDLKGKDQIQFYIEDVLLRDMNFMYQNPNYANSDASKASIVLHNSILLAQSEKLRMALLDLSKKTNGQFGRDYDDYLRKSRIVKKDFQFQYESILRRAYYDSKTVDMVSTRMTSILTGKPDPNKIGEAFKKSKLIMVPHSAGNQVVKSSYDRVFHSSDETYMNNQEKEDSKRYLGVLNMASPSSTSTLGCLRENGVNENCKNEAIKLDFDFVIQGSNYIAQPRDEYSMAPNFSLDKSKTATSFIFRTFEGVANIFDTGWSPLFSFVSSIPSGASLHGMNEVYLSEYVHATEKNSNTSEKMKDIFVRKLASVAESLESNCSQPKAVITYDGDPSEYETSFTKKYRFYANESLLYDDKPDSKGSFKIYKWKILKKEVVDFDEGHTDLVLASKTLGRDITFTKEGPENFFDVTIENYQEFTVSLEVVREDGGSNYTEFRFWPKLMDAKYSSSRITYCYKMDKRGTPAFYMDVIISGNNHQGTTFYLYWETNDQPSDYFGINVTDTYLGLRNVWGVYGDNLTFRLTKRVNFVSQDMIELGSYPVPVCRP